MKKTLRPQYHRIRRILEMIREGTEGGRLPNARDFGEELGVSRPTVMRDLDWLRDEENARIEYVPAAHGYRLSDRTWELPPVNLSRREVFAFSVAGRLLAAFRGTPLELDMESAFRKIAESLEERVTLDLDLLTERFSVVAEDYVQQDPGTWALVARHLDRGQPMRVRYEKFNGEVKDHVLEPYHLVAYHGNWYVLAKTEGREEPATFALSRIRSAEPASGRFEIPESFDPQAHLGRAFGIVRGQKPFRVRLLFSPKVSSYVRERIWHPTQRMRQRRNGSLELAMETGGWKELVRWVLSWQPDCRVLAPRRLRDRIEQKMRQGLGLQAHDYCCLRK